MEPTASSRKPLPEARFATPTFFVVGAVKAGTTALHLFLDQHPEIYMSPVKETNFFSQADMQPEHYNRDYRHDVNVNLVSSSWGDEITSKARNALVIFILVVAAFISIRFEWRMAIGAIVFLWPFIEERLSRRLGVPDWVWIVLGLLGFLGFMLLTVWESFAA